MNRKKILTLVRIGLAAVFVIAAFNIGKTYYDYHKADTTYQELQTRYVSSAEAATPPQEGAETPAMSEPSIAVDFASLVQKNNDVIGWLYSPDTVISYPVVQGNNNEHYLRRDLSGNYLVSGTLFADYRNGALGEDANYIIYGHNMKNGTMFRSLPQYKDQAYYDRHPVLYYLTPGGNYKLELFAGLVVKRDDAIYQPTQDKAAFFEMLKEYTAKSTFRSEVAVTPADTIVTLSTCSYEFDHARYIVIGKLTPL